MSATRRETTLGARVSRALFQAIGAAWGGNGSSEEDPGDHCSAEEGDLPGGGGSTGSESDSSLAAAASDAELVLLSDSIEVSAPTVSQEAVSPLPANISAMSVEQMRQAARARSLPGDAPVAELRKSLVAYKREHQAATASKRKKSKRSSASSGARKRSR